MRLRPACSARLSERSLCSAVNRIHESSTCMLISSLTCTAYRSRTAGKRINFAVHHSLDDSRVLLPQLSRALRRDRSPKGAGRFPNCATASPGVVHR